MIEKLIEDYIVDYKNILKRIKNKSKKFFSLEDLLLDENITDIHFENTNNTSIRVKIRKNGVLFPINDLSPKIYEQFMISLLSKSKADILNLTYPKDVSVVFKGKSFRVSILPSKYGISNCVIRRLKSERDLKEDYLYIDPLYRKSFDEISNLENGLVLISGPTGSGKTTTLAYITSKIAKKGKKIISIEDPIEYVLSGVVQIEVKDENEAHERLKNILRHDPDVIIIGEIRTREMAKTAIEASLTGHLVISTIHSNNILSTFNRFENWEIEKENLMNSLVYLISQRLIGILCEKCKVRKGEYYIKNGCEACFYTGYERLAPIYEMIKITRNARKILNLNKIEEIYISNEYTSYEIILEKFLKEGKISVNDMERIKSSFGGI